MNPHIAPTCAGDPTPAKPGSGRRVSLAPCLATQCVSVTVHRRCDVVVLMEYVHWEEHEGEKLSFPVRPKSLKEPE